MALVGLPRCRLGRSGSSFKEPVPVTLSVLFRVFLASSGVWRLRVGRSGSFDEGGSPAVVDPVDPLSVVVVSPGVRRVMVGRSGSSVGVLPVVVVVPVLLV